MVKRYEIIGHDWYTSEESTGTYVTHADYRALEEQSAYFRKEWNKAEGKTASLEEELASIKARVGELVGAAENTLAVEKRYGLGGSASDRLSSALEAFK